MNLIEYLNQKGITLRQKNASEFCSPCPMCGGKDRFTFWPDRGRFFCRGCNKSGDIIDLIRSVDGLSYTEACSVAGKKADGIKQSPVVKDRVYNFPGELRFREKITPCDLWLEKASAFIEWAHDQLLRNPDQLEWLKDYRGITLETVKRFKIGWNNRERYYSRVKWGLPEAKKADGKSRALWLPIGLVIPCYSFSGELLRLKIRRPDSAIIKDSDTRYVFVAGGSVALSYFGAIRSAFIVVESELDAILLYQTAGETVTPVSPGSANNKPDQESFTLLSEARLLLISLDNDSAGQLATKNCWKDTFSNSRSWAIPDRFGKDHTEAMLKGLDLKEWLVRGMNENLTSSKPHFTSELTGVQTPAF